MVNLPTAGVDFHVPFGGRKGSSYGPREQGSYAREFYTQVKTSYVRSGVTDESTPPRDAEDDASSTRSSRRASPPRIRRAPGRAATRTTRTTSKDDDRRA